MGNSFGHLFKITTWGESHGGGVGVVVDGCPAGIEISIEDIQYELDRRKPGQSDIVTPRKEDDKVLILSGMFEGKTLGTPISLMVKNKDAKPESYSSFKDIYRPSHADYTYQAKYGIRNWQGGGRASARETIGRVAAGAIAKKCMEKFCSLTTLAYVIQVHTIKADIDRTTVKLKDIEANIIRCPDAKKAQEMIDQINDAKQKGDSLGGVIECVIQNVPVGLGAPVFDKLKADLAKAMMSLPATMGIEFGSGFSSVDMTGSDHNDEFYMDGDIVRTKTNFSGGMQGGISNGEDIYFKVAFKPTATIFKKQGSVTTKNEETTLQAKGRHDPCVIARAVPIIEAMSNIVMLDHYLRSKVSKADLL
jgi:chorismate synthase